MARLNVDVGAKVCISILQKLLGRQKHYQQQLYRQTDIQSAREFHSHFITISGGWCLFLFNVQALHIIFYYVSVVAE